MIPGLFDLKEEKKDFYKPWMKNVDFILVNKDNIIDAIDDCINSSHYGFDTETTGLDTRVFPIFEGGPLKTQVDIAGICLAPRITEGRKRAYYIPMRHCPGGVPWKGNVPLSIVEKEILRLIKSDSIAVFHNSKYDQEVLQFNGSGVPYGEWDNPNKFEDTIILISLYDSTRMTRGLKKLSQEFLGREMIRLEELFEGKNFNFSELDPESPGCVEYAASDAVCTVDLFFELRDKALILPSKDSGGNNHTQEIVYIIEKMCVSATRWMERSRIYIDRDRVEELIRIGQKELFISLQDVYRGSTEAIGRDITPLSFYLLKRKIDEEYGGDIDSMEITVDDPQPFRKILEECRSEADKIIKLYDKSDFGILKKCSKDTELSNLLERETPGIKKDVQLLKEYDILSAKQLGVLIHDLGIEVKRTDKGNIQTSEEVIKNILDEHSKEVPFISSVSRVRSNYAALNRLSVLYRDADSRDSTVKSEFNAFGTNTGRFSVKKEKNSEYESKTSEDGITNFNPHATPAMSDPSVPKAVYYTRTCIASRRRDKLTKKIIGKIVAADFSGVELRIITNYSREPKWIDAFFRCSTCGKAYDKSEIPPKYCIICGSDRIGDIHTLTGIELFGPDAPMKPDWKKKRGFAKGTNFSMAYGGGANAVQHATRLDKNECFRIVKKFKTTFKVLREWWENKYAFARKWKYVLTAFGRKFPLPDIDHEESVIRAAAERNSINSPVQGCSADITKIAMSLVYKECKKRNWLDKVNMIITVHDELVFDVDDSILEEFCRMACKVMTVNKPVTSRDWPIPLTVDCEIGIDWSVPWNMYQIDEAMNLKSLMKDPNTTDQELKNILRRVDGFFGGMDKIKKKFNSFEDIHWPKELNNLFESGREDVLTDENRKALKRAWDMYFGIETAEEDQIKEQEPQMEEQLLGPTNKRIVNIDVLEFNENEIEKICKLSSDFDIIMISKDGKNIAELRRG